MALQYWFPLTQDSRQQGLNSVAPTIMGTGITFVAGKLGKAAQFPNNCNSCINVPGLKLQTGSWAAWIKVLGSGATARQCLISEGRDSYNDGVEFYTSQAGTTLYFKAHTVVLSTTIALNTWYHVVGTFGNNSIKLYVDGVLKASNTYTDDMTYTYSNDRFVLGKMAYSYTSTGNYFAYNGCLNDVRVYDHVLSQMEVKELSKGLALHYPLADSYVEATTNLITTEDCLSVTCYNGATSKYGYGTNTDMYKTVTTYDGRKGTKVYMGTDGNAAFPYVYIDNMYTSDGTNSPAYKTLSFDYYTNIGTSIRPYKLGSGSGTATYRITNKNGVATGTGTDAVSIPVVTNGWNHIEITFHGTTAADSQWGYIQNYPSHTSNTNNFWFFANMQLEIKDHATGYAGVGGIRSVNTIYDCSGFVNNGTINGSLTISDDTPKYSVSTYMSKTALITHPRPVFGGTDQEWTCAMWVKLDNVTQEQQAMNNFNISNNIVHSPTPLLYLNNGTNDYYMYGSQAVSAGVWTHVVFVFKNSDGTRNIYINGVLKNNYGPNKTSIPIGIPDIVTVGTNLAGYISDYRIYATALSADDVKSLYQNSAYIDNSGNVYGAVHSEV